MNPKEIYVHDITGSFLRNRSLSIYHIPNSNRYIVPTYEYENYEIKSIGCDIVTEEEMLKSYALCSGYGKCKLCLEGY